MKTGKRRGDADDGETDDNDTAPACISEAPKICHDTLLAELRPGAAYAADTRPARGALCAGSMRARYGTHAPQRDLPASVKNKPARR
jgi:hypothetical protein